MPLSHTCTDGATQRLDQILSDLGTELRRSAHRRSKTLSASHQMAVAERALLAHERSSLTWTDRR